FLAYLGTLQGQLAVFAGLYSSVQVAGAGIDRVIEVLGAEQQVEDRPGGLVLTTVKGHVQFEGVSFGYDEDRPILKNVSFEGFPGQTVAIVGPTGAGKSTLVSLIPRFFDPWNGSITIDGCDVREITLKSLRSMVGIVL